jgi:hypothetical protein
MLHETTILYCSGFFCNMVMLRATWSDIVVRIFFF